MTKLLTLVTGVLCAVAVSAQDAKYVFYLIGDGMGLPQIALAEAASGTSLAMRRLPVLGLATTHAADRAITCSAAAGTALATGHKTSIGTLSMTPDRSAPLATIAECAHDRGMKVGIVSSVSIDHATPAAFYAHVPRRDMYEEVGNALLASGFDYFAGGSPRWNKRRTLTSAAEFELAAALRGYTFTDTRSELAAARGKVVATLNMLGEGGYTAGSSAMPYAIDRHTLDPENRLSLADFLRRGVELLDGPDGFLIMAEGGNIDWAAHSNDAPTLVREIQDFDAALTVALEFQAAHPDETLIVVTADHETGGLTLGRRDRNYDSDFDALTGADRSVEYTGVEYDTVEAADTSINRSAGIAWTTGAHTALPAVVMASGPGSARFAGFQDNTDIPRKIALAIGLQRLNN